MPESQPFYEVQIEPVAWDEIMSLWQSLQERIFAAIERLEVEPRPRGALKLKGIEATYRIRIGDYRVFYQVQDKILLVLVVKVGNRKDVYR